MVTITHEPKISNRSIFFFNFIILLVFSYFAYKNNGSAMLQGLDGAYMLDLARQQFQWGLSSMVGLTNNIFQSLGNINFPLNTQLIPGYFISLLLNNGEVNKTLSYMIFTSEIFVAIYAFCLLTRFSLLSSIVACWLFVLISFPIVGLPKIYATFSLVPQNSTAIAESILLMTLFYKSMDGTIFENTIYGLAMSLLVLHVSISSPTIVVMLAPWLAFFWLSCSLQVKSKKDVAMYLYSSVVCLLIVGFVGCIGYFLGLFQYTAAKFYASEFYNPKYWSSVSIVFLPQIEGVLLFIGGVLGACLEAFTQKGVRKNLAITLLCYIIALLILGVCVIHTDLGNVFPESIYFEFCVWPLYAIYSANILVLIFEKILSFINVTIPRSKFTFLCNTGILLPLSILMLYFITLNNHKYYPLSFPYPPKQNIILDTLKNEAGLIPNSEFKGRVATFTGLEQDESSWFSLPKFDNCADVDYTLLGLSYNNIPSLFEYNPLISPSFFYFTKNLLAYPQDKQTRNVMVLRHINQNILKLVGVRFLITDVEINTNAKLIVSDSRPKAHLYELENANLGQYSPTQLILTKYAQDAMSLLSRPDFDFEKYALINTNVNYNLVQAERTKMVIKKDGVINIQSHSAGKSLLVIPLEYSNCLEFIRGNNKTNKIIRVDLLLTGILFEHNIDVDLKYFTGLRHNTTCRLIDTKEAKNLGVGY